MGHSVPFISASEKISELTVRSVLLAIFLAMLAGKLYLLSRVLTGTMASNDFLFMSPVHRRTSELKGFCSS